MACNAWKLAPVCIAVCFAVKIYSVMASEGFLILNVSCPGSTDAIISANHSNISVNLMRPDNVIAFWIDRVCIKGNNTDYVTFNINRALPSYHDFIVVDPGTVCLFVGGYASIVPSSQIVTVNESCGVPALQSTGKARLNLTCFDSIATVEVVALDGDATLNHTDVLGRCITPDCLDNELTECIHVLLPGNSSISGLPNKTICTFYGSYRLQTSETVEFEPVQCIMNHPPPPTISLPPDGVTTTEDITTTTTAATTSERTLTTSTSAESILTTSTSAATTTESALTTSTSALTTNTSTESALTTSTTEITNTNATSNGSATSSTSTSSKGRVSSFNLAVLILVPFMTIGVTFTLMAVVCLAWRWYHWKMRREQKKQLHIWDLSSEETLDQDPHILPQFPHAPDSISIITEIDYLYKEEERNLLTKSINTDEKAIDSPKLIMDRFVSGCHQRVSESSHESLSNVSQHGATYDNTCPISSISKLASDSCDVMAQHYTLNTNQQRKLDDDVTDDNHMREFTPSSVPTENYFTDDEGYLRFTNETAL